MANTGGAKNEAIKRLVIASEATLRLKAWLWAPSKKRGEQSKFRRFTKELRLLRRKKPLLAMTK
jgi:hypothetical protein